MTKFIPVAIYFMISLIALISIFAGRKDKVAKTSVKLISNLGNLALAIVVGKLVSSFVTLPFEITYLVSGLVFIVMNVLIDAALRINRNVRYGRRVKREHKAEFTRSRNKAMREVRNTKEDRRSRKLNRRDHFKTEKAKTSRIIGALLGLINGLVIGLTLFIFTHFAVSQFNVDLYNTTFLPEIVKIEQIENIIERI